VSEAGVKAGPRKQRTPRPLAFSAFLSHRYRSPSVNRFFFRMFAEVANVEFSVDKGSFATNVTRLERLMRDADAFVGLYPFPGTDLERPGRAELEKESRYFRLELDLAERSGKPSIVFVDSRYGGVIEPPPSIMQCRFDWQQVGGDAPVPRAAYFRDQFRFFCRQVRASLAHGAARTRHDAGRTNVAIMLPEHRTGSPGYTPDQIAMVHAIIGETGVKPLDLAWPPRLDMAFARVLETLDWIVVDVGDASAATGLVAYLHGRFIPALRLRRIASPASSAPGSLLVESLYGAYEVGYRKDIVEWYDDATLRAGVQARIDNIMAERQRIADIREAERYFGSAALRKESVFVSYSGQDETLAAPLIAALKRRFQQVFDYRDKGASIPPGSHWIETVFQRLSTSPVGIILLSPDYFESGNCVHEGQEMIALTDAKRMTVFPIKLRPGDLALPPWMTVLQYLRYWEYSDAVKMVDVVVAGMPAP
jgi:hypothetical protein